MVDFLTIAEFQGRQLRNELRTVAKSRLRIVMWVLSGIAFAGFVAARLFALHYTQRPPAIDARSAALYTGVYLGYISITFVLPQTPGAQFASLAEALLVGTSALETRAVFMWLQLRALGRTIVRTFVVLVILATTGSANGAQSARMTLLGFALILIPPAFSFHLSIASQRTRTTTRVIAGIALLCAIPIGLNLVPGASAPMNAQAHGAYWPTLCVLLVAVLGIALPPLGDPIPELVAAARPGGIVAQRLAERLKNRKTKADNTASDRFFDLGGVWVILSARLAAFFRARRPRDFALGLAAWFALGLALGGAGRRFGPSIDDIILSVAATGSMIVFVVVASIGRGLNAELRNPLWWTGDAALVPRLAVDALASLWRFVVTSFAVLAGYAALGHFDYAAWFFVFLTTLVWLARCCGYLLFAFFPAAIDQRGALAGLRIFILFVLAIPVVATALLCVGFLQLPPALEVAATVGVGLAEALGLLYVAARRIDGRFEAYLSPT